MTLESTIETYLIKRVKRMGGEVRKLRWIGRRGAPDRLVLFPSSPRQRLTSFFIELKAPGKKPTKQQVREIEKLQHSGFTVFTADSKEAVDMVLRNVNGGAFWS